MTKTKLLIATDCFLPRKDGTARYLAELIPLMKKTFDITVIAPAHKGDIPKTVTDGIKLIRVPLRDFKIADFKIAKPKYREIKREIWNADVVWTQALGPIGMMAIWAAKRTKVPVVASIHVIENEIAVRSLNLSGTRKKFMNWFVLEIMKFFYNRCYHLIVPSKNTLDTVSKSEITTKRTIVNLGVNTDAFSPIKDKAALRRRLGIPTDKFVIGYCGRIAKEKNLSTLKRAFDFLRLKHKNLYLLIVGDGPERHMFKGRDIKVTGFADNVVPYLRAMDAFVLPSLTETTSLSTMEAMSVGLPVIVTPVGFMRTYIENGFNGLFFPKEDIEALARDLEGLMNNERHRRELGSNARKTITRTYKWTKTAREVITILRRVHRETADD